MMRRAWFALLAADAVLGVAVVVALSLLLVHAGGANAQTTRTSLELKNTFTELRATNLFYRPVIYNTLEFVSGYDALEPNTLISLGGVTRVVDDLQRDISFERNDNTPAMPHGIQLLSRGAWRQCRFNVTTTPDADTHTFAFHTSARVPSADTDVSPDLIYVFGGLDANLVPHNEVRVLSITDDGIDFACVLETVNITGPAPPPRFGHTMLQIGDPADNRYAVYGGCSQSVNLTESSFADSDPIAQFICDAENVLSDLYILDLNARTWEQRPTTNLGNGMDGIPLHFHLAGRAVDDANDVEVMFLFSGFRRSSEGADFAGMLLYTLRGAITRNGVVQGENEFHLLQGSNYDALNSLSRGTLAGGEPQYFTILNANETRANARQLVVLNGRFGTNFTSFQWSADTVLPGTQRPAHIPVYLSDRPLSGAMSFTFDPTSDRTRGILSGFLTDSKLGGELPTWEMIRTDDSVIFQELTALRQPEGRESATIVPLGNNYILMGGITPRAEPHTWAVNVDDPRNSPIDTFVGVRSTPVPNTRIRRAGHCAVAVSDTALLVAGGFPDASFNESLFTFADAYLDTRMGISLRNLPLDGGSQIGNASYTSLQRQAHSCFNFNGTVLAVGGGIKERSDEAQQVSFWNFETGWTQCASSAAIPPNLWYAAATTIWRFQQPHLDEDDGQPVIVLFGGYRPMDGDFVESAEMWVVRCNVPWEECTCDDIEYIQYDEREPVSQRVESIEIDSWPSRRASACASAVGNHRAIMVGGHVQGSPRSTTWALEFHDGRPIWSQLGSETRITSADDPDITAYQVPILRADDSFGSVCFTRDNYFVNIGGAERSQFFRTMNVLRPTCNLGFGVPKNETYLTGVCSPCTIDSFRTAFEDDSCTPCPAGTQREVNSTGDSCEECVEGYCHHGSCFALPSGARCSCPLIFTGTQCESLNVSGLLQVVLVPISIIAVILIVWGIRVHLTALRDEQRARELELKEAERHRKELDLTFKINPDDLLYLDKIDSGAFGDVVKKYWSVKDEVVAVKILHSHVVQSDPDALKSFSDEIEFMKTLRHRNIVFFYGASLDHDDPFIVMQYVKKGSLYGIIEKAGMSGIPVKERLSYMRDAADGMNYLHGKARVHRDLKSLNLLVTERDVVKVADFTTATTILTGRKDKLEKGDESSSDQQEVGSGHTTTSSYGTLNWLAPEVLTDNMYSFAADVYSFAIVMWETYSGEQPFPEYRFYNQFVTAVAYEEQRPPLPDVISEANKPYVRLMEACWAPDPADRPSFLDALHKLENMLKEENSILA